MTDVRSMFEKDYIYAYDLQGRDVTVTIESVKQGELVGEGGKRTKKPVLRFRGKEKSFGCNITNARTIASMYGWDIRAWIGKRITLYPTITQMGAKGDVECIRIRPMIPTDAAKGDDDARAAE